jgi:DNA-binding transcriptional MerR regulator
MAQAHYLTSGAAAYLLAEITGHTYSPSTVRYYESTRRLPAARRTTTGIRLYREVDIRRLADRLVSLRQRSEPA